MQMRDEAQAREFGQRMRLWINDYERAHNRYRVPHREFADLVGVSEATFGR